MTDSNIDQNSTAELQALKNARRNLKSQLTRFKTSLEKSLSEEIPDLMQLELRLNKIENLLDEFNKVQLDIELIDTSTSSEIHDKERQEFEDNYFEIFSQGKSLLTSKQNIVITTTKSNENGNSSASSRHSSSSSHSPVNIKLPPISLPTFDGNYEQWLFFRDTYKSLIHENHSIPDVQKFHYLRLSLKGQAADLLKSLECSTSNYPVAWKLLIDRYENKQILIRNHIKALFDVESTKKECHLRLRKLLDTMTRHLRALEVLGQSVNSWDALIIHMMSLKLDPITRREWESTYSKLKDVTIEYFTNFLQEKCKLLETLSLNDSQSDTNNVKSKTVKTHALTRGNSCNYCKKDHLIYNCKEFISLSVNKRNSEAKRLNLCLNCLRNNHKLEQCRSIPCRKCDRRHNTLLHINADRNQTISTNNQNANDFRSPVFNENSENSNNELENKSDTIATHLSNNIACSVLLPTPLVNVLDRYGHIQQCRVLLDSGSESSFITEALCNKLKLPLTPVNCTLSGIGLSVSKALQQATVHIQSRQNAYEMKLKCLVLKQITSHIPSISVEVGHLSIPPNLLLADPTFNESSQIDILIGADRFWELTNVGQIKLGKHLPTLQKTHFGWVISGVAYPKRYNSQFMTSCNLSVSNNIDSQITKFWELEETNLTKPLSDEESSCENLFQNTTLIQNGRFTVNLPLKHPSSLLGDSKQSAIKRFLSLEKKLLNNSKLCSEYSKFLNEYETLGHMTKIELDNVNSSDSFFLPHHCVFKDSNITTKLRVVFDGSAKTTSGYSLNDILMVGPTVQEDLFSILLRSRQHNILLSGDIEKMYRQVLVNENQRNLQLILWRPNPSDEIQCFQLNTLTYGTAPAAYLSTRCLKELANMCAENNPKVSSIISRDFYVDDLLTGGESVKEVKELKEEITNVLRSGGFQLRKFLSNNPDIVSDGISNSATMVHFADSQQGKTLGLLWDSHSDVLRYSIKAPDDQPSTKRIILSQIAQIFDPLGLVAPVVITAKTIIQKLWQCKISWDESIPIDLHTTWKRFQSQLPELNRLEIPRHVVCQSPSFIELHCFSDASEIAYGACIYLRSMDNLGNFHIHLLCAKTRVAPLKTITIPRLEFCAALLLSELTDKVKNSLSIQIHETYYWCDSTIVLSWIKASPHLWKIFVSNRVSQIQSLTDIQSWSFINTHENPADLLSRGVKPSALINNNLWWKGPTWLSEPKSQWPTNVDYNHSAKENVSTDFPEIRNKQNTLTSTISDFNLITKYSKLDKLQRITAYCYRFINNSKLSRESRNFQPLDISEIKLALNNLIKIAQREEFTKEMHDLSNSRQVHSKSKLLKVNPFIDVDGLLRVGGRIKHSDFPREKKHPAILPSKHHLSLLIVQYEHIRLLHAGPQTLLASIRDRYWPVSGRNLVKQIVRNCIRCFRFNAPTTKYLMGDLPRYRLTPTRPFLNTGIDYCGPFLLKDRSTRNYKCIKAYICLFVCLSTKAIHLELVGDLSTKAFLATLRRFFARRGLSSNIYSDHGTNFIGASNEIEHFIKIHKDEIQSNLNHDGVKWHFIPPRAPHFGGIWEAGVKSTKFHLKRVINNVALTFEEFSTVLAQIEACLNSRPLHPLSTHPDDPQPLTPAHFLIGEKLTTIPEDTYCTIQENRLTKYQRLQQLVQHFWSRWSKEFISELQQRSKWNKTYNEQLKPGSVVLVKEDNLPPLKWQMGIIQAVHPGNDGIVRAATIKTSTSVYKRPAIKLCVLPNCEQEL